MKISGKILVGMILGAVLLATGFWPQSGEAIVLRHDRDDAAYRELGAQYPATLRIRTGGTGVLVSPDWVLTAAHVVHKMREDRLRVTVGEEDIRITEVHIHPDWDGNGEHDIALVKLEQPVQDIEPVALYEGDDEQGKVITFVGYGDTGNGLTGPTSMDHVRRAATNTIFRVNRDWLFFRFDQGDDATDMEGVSGPGDSGGPALLEVDGVLYTLGVSVFGDGDDGPGYYGVLEGYTRVSTHLDWIRSIMSAPVSVTGSA